MLGPGLIMAGGIVGSGELIAATHTGPRRDLFSRANYFRLCDQMLHAGRNGASRHSQRRNHVRIVESSSGTSPKSGAVLR